VCRAGACRGIGNLGGWRETPREIHLLVSIGKTLRMTILYIINKMRPCAVEYLDFMNHISIREHEIRRGFEKCYFWWHLEPNDPPPFSCPILMGTILMLRSYSRSYNVADRPGRIPPGSQRYGVVCFVEWLGSDPPALSVYEGLLLRQFGERNVLKFSVAVIFVSSTI